MALWENRPMENRLFYAVMLYSVMMSRHQHIVTGYIMEVLDLYEVV